MKPGLLLLLFSVSAMPSAWPQATAQTPPSEPKNAEFHACTDYFYGVATPQSFEKAFACFTDADDEMWPILMTLNGQGTPFSLQKARELLARAEQKPENIEDTSINAAECCDPQILKNIEQIIAGFEKDPKPGHLSICDFEVDRTTMVNCQLDLMEIMERKREEALKPIEATLSPSAKASLGQIRAIFAEFRKADSAWRLDEFFEGAHNDASPASNLQDALDFSNFASLITKIAKDHALPRCSEQEFRAKDKELNAVYRQRISNEIESDAKDRAEYLDSAKQAQRLWLKLEDTWKKFCEELFRGKIPPEEIDRAIATLLRQIRIHEIQTDLASDQDFFGTEFLLR